MTGKWNQTVRGAYLERKGEYATLFICDSPNLHKSPQRMPASQHATEVTAETLYQAIARQNGSTPNSLTGTRQWRSVLRECLPRASKSVGYAKGELMSGLEVYAGGDISGSLSQTEVNCELR